MSELNIRNASKELNILRSLKKYKPPFEVMGTYRLIDDGERPEATVMLKAGDQEMHQADIGVGPVDALANVLKKSLGRLFPFLLEVRLVDFEVRMMGPLGLLPGSRSQSLSPMVNLCGVLPPPPTTSTSPLSRHSWMDTSLLSI
jgi:hypothetical protein